MVEHTLNKNDVLMNSFPTAQLVNVFLKINFQLGIMVYAYNWASEARTVSLRRQLRWRVRACLTQKEKEIKKQW